MGLGETLSFIITGNGASAAAAFRQVAASAKAAADETTAQITKLTAVAEAAEAKQAAAMEKVARGIGGTSGIARNQAIADRSGNTAQKARQDLAAIQGDAPAAGGALAQFGIEGAAAGAAVAAGVAAAALAVAKFSADSISHFVKATDAVREFQATSGATAEGASKLLYAANALGIPVDGLSTTIFRLGATVHKQPEEFARWGVAIAKAKDGSTDLLGTFNNVVARMSQLGQGADADALAKALVGRGAQTIAPLAQEYQRLIVLEKEAQAHGAVYSQADVQKAEDYKIAVAGLSSEFSHVEKSLAEGLIPQVTNFVTGLDRAILDVTSLSSKLDALGGAHSQAAHSGLARVAADARNVGLGVATGGISALIGGIEKLGSSSSNTAKKQGEAAQAARDYNDALARQAQEAQDATASVEQHDAAVHKVVDAATATVDADKAVADATQKLTEAQGAYAKKADDVATANRDLATSNRDLAKAEYDQSQAAAVAAENQQRNALAVRDSTFAVADAQDAYNKAVLEYGANSRQAAEAADAVTNAQLNHQDAVRKKNAPDTTVQDANDAVARATDARAQAQARLNAADAENPAQAVADAEANLAKAQIARGTAQAALNTAMHDSTVSADDLRLAFGTLMSEIAGDDPAVMAVYQHLEDAVLAAKELAGGIDNTGNANSGPDNPNNQAPAPPPPRSSGTANSRADNQSNLPPNPAVPKVPAPQPYDPSKSAGTDVPVDHLGGAKTASVTNITVNASTNADPNEIAHAIVSAQAVRR